mgnify:CR=1 FL=1
MLKERGKWLQLRFNIPNILENKRNVERMLKQSLKAFKLFQHRFNILSTRFNIAIQQNGKDVEANVEAIC